MLYELAFDGRENLEKVELLNDGFCYSAINAKDGNFLGQIETVIPYGEKGFLANPKNEGLTVFGFIDGKYLEEAIQYLEDIGIKGFILVDEDQSGTLPCSDDFEAMFIYIG